MANEWRTDKPPTGKNLEVWVPAGSKKARHSGKSWFDEQGNPLRDITHWREIQEPNEYAALLQRISALEQENATLREKLNG
jgi:hypothetical protein